MSAKIIIPLLRPGMADFQYQPDPDDRIVKVRQQMDAMDGRRHPGHEPSIGFGCLISARIARGLQNFTLAPELEDYTIYDEPPVSDLGAPDSTNDTSNPGPSAAPSSKPRSNLRLFPPPLFSRQTIPQLYK